MNRRSWFASAVAALAGLACGKLPAAKAEPLPTGGAFTLTFDGVATRARPFDPQRDPYTVDLETGIVTFASGQVFPTCEAAGVPLPRF